MSKFTIDTPKKGRRSLFILLAILAIAVLVSVTAQLVASMVSSPITQTRAASMEGQTANGAREPLPVPIDEGKGAQPIPTKETPVDQPKEAPAEVVAPTDTAAEPANTEKEAAPTNTAEVASNPEEAERTQGISAKAIVDHECDGTEWHFVITQVRDQASAPDSITVRWDNGESEDVTLWKYTGSTAHYVTTSNIDAKVTSADADIYSSWSGQFNLSHGPCGTPNPQPTSTPTTATCNCNGDVVVMEGLHTVGNRAFITLKNTSTTCEHQVGLASYERVDNNIDHQVLYDSDTTTLAPGETATLSVSLPECAYQVDAFCGDVLNSFGGGVRYGPRLIEDDTSTDMPYCGQVTPTDTVVIPTDTPVPTDTPTDTPTVPTDTPTNTPTVPTDTPTVPTDTPTNTSVPTDTMVPSVTETPTETSTYTPTKTNTPTKTPTKTSTNTPTRTPTATNTITPCECEQDVVLVERLTVVGGGGQIKGTLKNNSLTCAHEVGIATYKKFDNIIDNQVIYDWESYILQPGETHTLYADLPGNPPCAYQADLFCGPVLMSLTGVRYGPRLIDYKHGGTDYCNNTPTPTKTSTPTGTSTETPTPTPTKTNTPTPTDTETPTPTKTNTPTPTPTDTETPTPTYTTTETPTVTHTITETPTPTPTKTNTPTPTDTETPTPTPTKTNTPTPTDTETPTPTKTNTPTPTPTKTSTPTPTDTETPTPTPTKTNTPTPTDTNTPTPTPTTPTVTDTIVPTITPTQTNTPTPTPTLPTPPTEETETPTDTPTPTSTVPTATVPTATVPTATVPTATNTIVPTNTPTSTATVPPPPDTSVPTATPTNTPLPTTGVAAFEGTPTPTVCCVQVTPKPPKVLPIAGQVVLMLVIGTVLSASAAIFLVGMFARRRKARDDEFNLY